MNLPLLRAGLLRASVLAALCACGFGDLPARPPPEPPPPLPEPIPPPARPAPLCWSGTGTMQAYRSQPGAALLRDGRVLVVGGQGVDGNGALRSAELYDPDTGAWTLTAPMQAARMAPVVVTLQDGRVLVAGGFDGIGSSFGGTVAVHASAELYDPSTDTWSAAAPMRHARWLPKGLRLGDGRVLVGLGVITVYRQTLELYDPASDTWTELLELPWNGMPTGAPAQLPDGRPFFASGIRSAAYDPRADAWTPAAPKLGPGVQRAWAFPDGRVLSPRSFEDGAGELYIPVIDSWTATGRPLEVREDEQLALLQDGRLLLTGGLRQNDRTPLATSELFDPDSRQWSAAGWMAQPRAGHVLVTLSDGRVLAAGGFAGFEWLRTTELFDPTCPGAR